MHTASLAINAYQAASGHRSQREQEAEVFLMANRGLRSARDGAPLQRVQALADNRRLWLAVTDLMRDPLNALPQDLRASILAVGMTVRREMDQDPPDLDFLIEINDQLAGGLTGSI
jgi:flagellar biosynthesis activator protein FlaF